MKIVCDACAAKYSIADDKVKGKVFKIRCKKCSNIIVVRGTAGAADEPAAGPYDQKETRVYDYGGYDGAAPAGADEGVWHIVVDQEQVGPLTVAEVQARFAAGEIDSESYIWREGFSDWLPNSGASASGAGAPVLRAERGLAAALAPNRSSPPASSCFAACAAKTSPGSLLAAAAAGSS